jgi:hypothetical protein
LANERTRHREVHDHVVAPSLIYRAGAGSGTVDAGSGQLPS